MSDITCPYCKHEMDVDPEDHNEFVMECYECEKEFNVSTDYKVTYSESCLDDLHEFQVSKHVPSHEFCKYCSNIRKVQA